jgi:hypothetical protein
MTRRLPIAVLAAWLALTVSAGAGGAEGSPDGAISAGGRLAWIFSPELDLLGDLRADIPFAVSRHRSFYLSLDALTAIEKASADFSFRVRELDYTLEAGARAALPSGALVAAFAGRRGKERVDAEGEPFAAYLGCGIESEGYRSGSWSRPLEWHADASFVAARRDVEGTLLLRGDARWLRRTGTLAFGADARVEALAGGGSGIEADVEAGPRIDVGLAGGRRVALFAHYLRARNPLGVETSGVVLGFDYAEGPVAGAGRRPAPPDVSGNVAAGNGGGRTAGRLEILVASPRFGTRYRAVLDVDANVLTAADTDELYYLYHLGIEGESGRRRIGIYAYHRSNHRLADPGAATASMNVLEAGIETAGYDRPVARDAPSRLGTLDYRARAGAVAQSTGGVSSRWNVRGGLCWSLPRATLSVAPFVRLEGEEGHVDRRAAAAGIAFRSGAALFIEWRRDDQYFSRDKSAWLLSAGRSF